jgi:hypothetical protein
LVACSLGYIRTMGLFDRSEDDPNLIAARADAEATLPEGWKLAEEDRERFLLVGPQTQISLEVWAAAAEGPNGELELAVACHKADAYTALARRLGGDLDTTEAWSPPIQFAERD